MPATDNILIQFILGNIGIGSNQYDKVDTPISFRIKYFFRRKMLNYMYHFRENGLQMRIGHTKCVTHR